VRWRRFFVRGDRLHPIWRAGVYLFGILTADVLGALGLSFFYLIYLLLSGTLPEGPDLTVGAGLPRWLWLGEGWWRLISALGLALFMGRFLDHEPTETMGLDRPQAGRDGLLGAALGLGTMGLVGALFVALGWANPGQGTAGVGDLLLDGIALLPAAIAEEIAFRGYLLRVFAEWRGPLVGGAVTSVLFALFHGLNPHVGPLGLVNILLAGAVFALAVERTGTLWLAVGYHFLWNLTQGPILGMPVSGMGWQGLLDFEVSGPAVWTGGPFGPEGGLMATLVVLISVLPLWALTRRPATVALACRNQRAVVEARFGPIPSIHHRLMVEGPLFDDLARAPARGRMGEVVLLLRRSDGRLLLHTKSFYPPGTYRLPSGGIRRGESVMDAARREVTEETRLTVGGLRPVDRLTYTLRRGRRRLFFHSWRVLVDVEGEPVMDDAEERIAGFRWIEPEELDGVAAHLRSLPGDWAGWGRFRAMAHSDVRLTPPPSCGII